MSASIRSVGLGCVAIVLLASCGGAFSDAALSDVRGAVATDPAMRSTALLYCSSGSEDATTPAAACDSDHPSACVREGFEIAVGRRGAADPERALALFERACAASDACGCLDVSVVLGSRRDRPSLTRAAELMRRGCEGGFVHACAVLGMDERGGLRVADGGPDILQKDPVAGHALVTRACDAQDAFGCFAAAANLLVGRGVQQSTGEAVRRLDQACAGGIGVGCSMVGFARLDGRGVAKSPTEAGQLFARACSLGHAVGCFASAQMYREGLLAPDDPARTRSLLGQACKGGVREACAAAGL